MIKSHVTRTAPGAPPTGLVRRLVPRRTRREWAADLGYALGALGLGSLILATALQEDNPPGVLLEVVLGGVMFVAMLLLRRSRPTGLTVTWILVGFFSAAVTGSAPVALLSLAIHRPWRAVASVAALDITLVTGTFWVGATSARAYWTSVLAMTLLITTAVATGMLIRSQRELTASWRERARQAEEGQRLRVEEARHLERERLAREMHDVLAHRISLLAIHAGALEYRAGASPEEARAAEVIRQCAFEALEDLREVIGVLRAHPDDDGDGEPERPQPVLNDLPALIEESRLAGATVDLDLANLPSVSGRTGRHAYRIVQEGLTNARKHAPGARVRVLVAPAPDDGLAIEVVNRLPLGHRPTAIPGAGAGLIGLRERVALIGGRLDHGPTTDGDFSLRVWLPLAK
ncbi:sensor histidine kinase [Embleya hyalina]|uniref:histidine kinase n=1 Tax=Embleya hyalina TaxID=516124 RepID=A0A401Z692_9ACTN|nr:histidine kinase [Embleya hyalina]GCE02374.1 two-component sensor histidine kinase [Embleya hyalina]